MRRSKSTGSNVHRLVRLLCRRRTRKHRERVRNRLCYTCHKRCLPRKSMRAFSSIHRVNMATVNAGRQDVANQHRILQVAGRMHIVKQNSGISANAQNMQAVRPRMRDVSPQDRIQRSPWLPDWPFSPYPWGPSRRSPLRSSAQEP